jgi:hypothetical protein
VRVADHPASEVDAALALLRTFARAQGVGWSRYHLLRGMALSHRGDARSAEAAFVEALREARARELAIDLARSKLALATLRADRGAETEARDWLRRERISEASVEIRP